MGDQRRRDRFVGCALGAINLFFISAQVRAQSAKVVPSSAQFPGGSNGDDSKAEHTLISNVAAAREMVRTHPDSAVANLGLGMALIASGERDTALNYIDRAVQLDSNLSDGWYQKGLLEADAERWVPAAECFRRALEGTSERTAARSELGNVLLRLGRFDEAASEFNSVLHHDASNASAEYGLGLVHLQEGNLSLAESQFRRVLALRPDFAAAGESLGETLLREHQYGEALVFLRGSVARNRESIQATNALGSALLGLGSSAAAQRAFQRARDLSLRQSARLRAISENNRGLLLLRANNLEWAAAAFRGSIGEDSEYAEPHNNLGGVLWQLDDLAAAMEEFRLAIRHSPNFASARNNLGSALLNRGEIDEAIGQFQAAVVLRPALAQAHYNLGRAFVLKGRPVDAELEFRRAIAITPEMASAHVRLGVLMASVHNHLSLEALTEMREGLRLDPSIEGMIPPEYAKALR